jgi:tetratricopeptide (TPR) repeat protein
MKRTALLLALLAGSSAARAQQPATANYDMVVQASLKPVSLAVTGTVAFTAMEACRDSVTVVLNKTMGAPSFRLLAPAGPAPVIKVREGQGGQVSYCIRFGRRLAAQAPVKLGFAYRGGKVPAAQFYVDSTFCMAGGYGAAWYPQVQAAQPDHTSSTMEGLGTIEVRTTGPLIPVMPGGLVQQTPRKGKTTTRFTYARPAILSLFIGPYIRSEYRGAIPMTAYRLRPDTATAGYLRRSAAVLAALSQEFGPYPFANFSLIEFPDAVSARLNVGGASENAGIVMPANVLSRPFNYALFGHELSHQWWGNLVRAGGSKGTGMLDEAMAQFGSLQVVKAFDPENAEAYRRSGYPGYLPDQSGLGYLKIAAAGADAKLSELSSANSHSIGDSKGFLALELLSQTIGQPKMRAALQAITRDYDGRPLSWGAFLAAIQQVAGQDLGWFYEQWFNRLGAPEWELAWKKQGRIVHLTITQQPPYYQLSPELLIQGSRGEVQTQTVALNGASTQLQVPADFAVKSVTLDPHFQVLHWEPEYREQAQALVRVQRVLQLRIAGQNDEAIKQGELELSQLTQAGQPDRYGVEFAICYHLGRVKGIQAKTDEALAYYLRAIKCSSRDTALLAYAYFRVAELARSKGDQPLFDWARANAINADLLAGNKDGMAKLMAKW